ncbi:MAG: hypothetical protein QUS14_12520 [Pyrinomonadaceae bacterium]|nr:hypothetical protein [Pyrinomonadaceae bacterium]
MKKLIILTFIAMSASLVSFAQSKADIKELREQRNETLRELREAKSGASSEAQLVPSDFNDTDSFGQNVKFLGSLYAGTLYVYKSCDPAVLQADLGLVLAPDDYCVVHDYVTVNGPRMPTTEIFDNVWQVTIPKNTISNVIYPLLNNTVTYDSVNGVGGSATVLYTPRLTIVSDALNDPAAVNPTTGQPLNGSLTVSLAGTRFKNFSIAQNDFLTEQETYASVAGRGLSRAFFRSIGLPASVINNLFKKDMTLKFGIRARVSGPIDFANFSYSFRLMGQ